MVLNESYNLQCTSIFILSMVNDYYDCGWAPTHEKIRSQNELFFSYIKSSSNSSAAVASSVAFISALLIIFSSPIIRS